LRAAWPSSYRTRNDARLNRKVTAISSAPKEKDVKKFINSVDTMLAESLDGFAAAHAEIVALGPERKFVRRRTPNMNKVALLSGGGSGHEPLHAGFVGRGMLDAACPGQVFTSPTPDQIVEAASAVGGTEGVLFIVKNYAGDCMNFEMAAELFEKPSATVVTNDDVAVEKSTYSAGRRGVAGTLVVEKMVGAAAEKGMDLKSCAALGSEVNGRTRSLGVALTSCTVPAAGSPTFTLGGDEMEMGVGIHGEPGRKRVKLMNADAIADDMVAAILADFDHPTSGEVLLLVNGFGGTPALELYLMYNAARRLLEQQGLTVARSLVGSLVTSLEMAGCSITATLLDASLTSLWDDHVHTPALRW
jgi:phosphoenolpyruvate---glycerone phosphotransferase subunit DhaK